MSKYAVTFGNHTIVLEEDELLEFVKTAVIRNKDISAFSVQRLDSNSRASVLASARAQAVESAFFRVFNV